MAAKRKTKAKSKAKRRSRRRTQRKATWGQKLLVGLSGIVMVMCAASITSGFFIRNTTSDAGDGRFRVAVLNGTGQAGLANAAKKGLLSKGIDVIEASNADSFDYQNSVLIARKRGLDVDALAEALGCANVIEQIQPDALEDATLILGADYELLRVDFDRR